MTSIPQGRPAGVVIVSVLAALLGMGNHAAAAVQTQASQAKGTAMSQNTTLTARQTAIGLSGAFAAIGDEAGLEKALTAGLNAELTVNEAKEVLVQVYAYAGFPRSLNALNVLMQVQEQRGSQGVRDAPGQEAGPPPTGDALLEAGTRNQTELSGAPVEGPVFEFAPAIDQFLKRHLFGDIFERRNLDWQSREIATLGMLSAQEGLGSQLEAHVRISSNVGISYSQMRAFAGDMERAGLIDAAQRLRVAVGKIQK